MPDHQIENVKIQQAKPVGFFEADALSLNITKKTSADDIKMQDIPDEIEKLKALMKVASGQLDFERAIEIRE